MKLLPGVVPSLVFVAAGVAVQIGFYPTLAWFRPGDIPAPVEAAAASVSAPAPVFATLSVPTVKFAKPAVEEPTWEERFPAVVAKIDPPVVDQASEATPAPVRASVARPSRHCAKYLREVPIPQRESILDDMEEKFKAALVNSNRQRVAYSRCKSKEQTSPGG